KDFETAHDLLVENPYAKAAVLQSALELAVIQQHRRELEPLRVEELLEKGVDLDFRPRPKVARRDVDDSYSVSPARRQVTTFGHSAARRSRRVECRSPVLG